MFGDLIEFIAWRVAVWYLRRRWRATRRRLMIAGGLGLLVLGAAGAVALARRSAAGGSSRS